MPTFQQMIAQLQAFWETEGCTIMQPYHTEVGAGTSNPATLLRVLGPKPWRTAYVEPSIRPDDGRYGENPYRFQQHYQYQVILKPAPDDSQDVYLRSLAAIGIDPLEHDIRFVEDNWESPSLGAWGLGWEVWMDGMEITQFTYFQQAGGIELDAGLGGADLRPRADRACTCRSVRRVHDLEWAHGRHLGDVYLEQRAPVLGLQLRAGRHRRCWRGTSTTTRREAGRCLEADLPLPAYDQVLKCSHAFNLLDSRRAIAVTDRGAYILRMRRARRTGARGPTWPRQPRTAADA